MRSENLIDIIRIYLLVIASSVFYTMFFVWGISTLINTDTITYRIIAVIIFTTLMIIGFCYYVPLLRSVQNGVEVDPKKTSNILALYLGNITTSALYTTFIMVLIGDFIHMEPLVFRVAAGILFITIAAGSIFYFSKRQRHTRRKF